jgi:hypothetical protein
MSEHRTSAQEYGRFRTEEYTEELARARHNHDIGTSLWLENDHIRVFETRLEPGERGPFHTHDRTYFWTVVDAGRGLQRFPDGTYTVRDYAVGDTRFSSTPMTSRSSTTSRTSEKRLSGSLRSS